MISTEPPTTPSDGEQSGQERPIHRGDLESVEAIHRRLTSTLRGKIKMLALEPSETMDEAEALVLAAMRITLDWVSRDCLDLAYGFERIGGTNNALRVKGIEDCLDILHDLRTAYE